MLRAIVINENIGENVPNPYFNSLNVCVYKIAKRKREKKRNLITHVIIKSLKTSIDHVTIYIYVCIKNKKRERI